MENEKLEFVSLDEFKQELLEQDPSFIERLKVHKLQQAMIQQLKQDRISQKLSQQEIAQRTGIKTQNISRLERGLVIPKADTLIKYAQALGGSFQYIPSRS
ncbi:helix-turn-helix transcriptional regulator [Mannheimia indoligenes]|uniref:Helix-turn-helix transcriptional regulator n=1 Tax=Mannheimia indoligenes TaxID=3103145 RepID=A0ABU7ZC79_9PAST